MDIVISTTNSLHKGWLFLLFILMSVATTFVIQELIIHDQIYYDHFAHQMAYERIGNVLSILKKWTVIYYLLLPVIYLVKFLGISLCLIAGALLVEKELSFKKAFQATIVGEFVFLIPQLIFILWFMIFKSDYNMEDLRFFEPLSLLSIFGNGNMAEWLVYPLKALNVFEIVYILVISVLLKESFGNKITASAKVLAPSYFFGLFVWLVFVAFVTLNIAA